MLSVSLNVAMHQADSNKKVAKTTKWFLAFEVEA
jgi:hypothetical protein